MRTGPIPKGAHDYVDFHLGRAAPRMPASGSCSGITGVNKVLQPGKPRAQKFLNLMSFLSYRLLIRGMEQSYGADKVPAYRSAALSLGVRKAVGAPSGRGPPVTDRARAHTRIRNSAGQRSFLYSRRSSGTSSGVLYIAFVCRRVLDSTPGRAMRVRLLLTICHTWQTLSSAALHMAHGSFIFHEKSTTLLVWPLCTNFFGLSEPLRNGTHLLLP